MGFEAPGNRLRDLLARLGLLRQDVPESPRCRLHELKPLSSCLRAAITPRPRIVHVYHQSLYFTILEYPLGKQKVNTEARERNDPVGYLTPVRSESGQSGFDTAIVPTGGMPFQLLGTSTQDRRVDQRSGRPLPGILLIRFPWLLGNTVPKCPKVATRANIA